MTKKPNVPNRNFLNLPSSGASGRTFISWSGSASKSVATALYDWLPKVIQAVNPWMSKADIRAGQPWSSEMVAALDSSTHGIVCLTPENLDSKWIHFESGAITKHLDTRLTPYLHGLEPGDVAQPLARFQMVRDDQDGTRELLRSLNEQLQEKRLDSIRIDAAFEKFWPDLKSQLAAIPSTSMDGRQKRSLDDMIEELLDSTRALSRQIQPVLDSARSNQLDDLRMSHTAAAAVLGHCELFMENIYGDLNDAQRGGITKIQTFARMILDNMGRVLPANPGPLTSDLRQRFLDSMTAGT
jgi:hypothetical protein